MTWWLGKSGGYSGAIASQKFQKFRAWKMIQMGDDRVPGTEGHWQPRQYWNTKIEPSKPLHRSHRDNLVYDGGHI